MTNNEVKLITQLIANVDQKVNGVDERIDGIALDVKDLLAFKWQVFGAGLIVSGLVAFATSLVVAYAGK